MPSRVQCSKQIDLDRIAAAVRTILEAVGEDPDREGLAKTPRRVAEMYCELFSGLHQDPREVLSTGFQESHKEMVILKNIPFYSLCEHHFLPFHGQAHVGYVPEGRIVGASKIARAIDILARRPALEMAYNPNDCPEMRWGASAGSADFATCIRHAPEEQRARMQDYRTWFHEAKRPSR